MPDHDDFEAIAPAHPYRHRLNTWSVVRLLPNLKTQTIARFRSRSDADGHLQFLRQQLPTVQFAVLFDLSE